MIVPLGIRNNNPGNLRPSSPPFLGQVGENGGFAVYDAMSNGIRALAKNLRAYFEAHGLNTIRGIITRWAPAADHNNTDAYIAAVSETCDVGPDAKLNVLEPDTMYWIVVGIGEHENGRAEFQSLVDQADINAGVYAALDLPLPVPA